MTQITVTTLVEAPIEHVWDVITSEEMLKVSGEGEGEEEKRTERNRTEHNRTQQNRNETKQNETKKK